MLWYVEDNIVSPVTAIYNIYVTPATCRLATGYPTNGGLRHSQLRKIMLLAELGIRVFNVCVYE